MCHVTSWCWPFMSLPSYTVSSPILPPSLFNSSPRDSLASKSIMFPFPSFGESSRKSPGRVAVCACRAVCPSHRAILLEGEGHMSPCRHLLRFGLSWQEQLRHEESCDCRKAPNLFYLLLQLFERPSLREFSDNLYPSVILYHRQ